MSHVGPSDHIHKFPECIIGGASAATVRSSKLKFAIYTWVRIYPPGVVAIGVGYRVEGRGFDPCCGTLVFFLSLLFFFSLSFSPSPLFLPSLPFISAPSFVSLMLAPPLQCSSIFSSIMGGAKDGCKASPK